MTLIERLFYYHITTQEGGKYMFTEDEMKFLELVHNEALRERLLARLTQLELLDAFLQAESGTTPTT